MEEFDQYSLEHKSEIFVKFKTLKEEEVETEDKPKTKDKAKITFRIKKTKIKNPWIRVAFVSSNKKSLFSSLDFISNSL